MMPAAKGETVKVQLAIASTAATDDALVYAQGRRRMEQRAIPDHVRRQMNGDVKGYFHAVWGGSAVGWKIGQRVANEDW